LSARIIIDSAGSATFNMAADEALLQACQSGNDGFPVFRFYWWENPTLSLGAKERLSEAADLQECIANNISLVRRSTGGRAVLHDKELTYSIIAPTEVFPFDTDVERSYQQISKAMLQGLAATGIELEITAGQRKIKPQSGSVAEHMPCFAAPSRHEITYKGKKVIGSAQRRVKGAVLQHGSILLKAETQKLAQITGAGAKETELLQDLMIGLEDIKGERIERQKLIDPLAEAFRINFDASAQLASYTTDELKLIDNLRPEIDGRLTKY
jgi:lipoate-protein ligase A